MGNWGELLVAGESSSAFAGISISVSVFDKLMVGVSMPASIGKWHPGSSIGIGDRIGVAKKFGPGS